MLGRLIRAWVGDRLRGEALVVVILTGLSLVLLFSHYLGWALLQPVLTGENAEAAQMTFWLAQIASFIGLVLIAGIGFRSPITVDLDPDGLHLYQGSTRHHVALDAIDEVQFIDARLFHRHYRRYAATRVFSTRPAASVLLITTPDAPVIVAWDDLDQLQDLRDALREREMEVVEESPAATG